MQNLLHLQEHQYDKEEKSTLRTFYGGSDYIDKYTIKQSVEDGNTLAINIPNRNA